MELARLRVPAATIAAGMVAALAVPAVAKPSERLIGLFAYRTTTGAASLKLMISATPANRPSMIAIAMATMERGRIDSIELAGVLMGGASDQAHARARGERTALCDKGVCAAEWKTYSAGSGITIDNRAGDGRLNAVFILARGATVEHKAQLRGWAIKPVKLPYRLATGSDSADIGAYGGGSGAEIFSEASAPGGRHGSVAVSHAPCSQATTNAVSRGVGTLALDGGDTRQTFTCPTSRGSLASWTYRRTRWRVHGTVAGETTLAETRLFVMELPPTLPVPKRWPWR